jgi:hypothetical protein
VHVWQQGLGLQHHDYAVDAPGKESAGRAHQGGRASVGQSGVSARRRPRQRESAAAPASTGSCRGG